MTDLVEITIGGSLVGYVKVSWDGAVWSCYNCAKVPFDKRLSAPDAKRCVEDYAKMMVGDE